MTFQAQYLHLLYELLRAPEETNARTGEVVRVGRPQSFTIDLSDGLLPVCGVRKLYPKTAAAETAWYLMGTQDVTWLRNHAKIWDKFTEADGVTVAASYGYRWRRHFGRDQLAEALASLRKDPSNRRVFVSAWDPGKDGLVELSKQKNVPCPVGFTLSISRGALDSTILMRSSDVFVGLPYDVCGHAMLMDIISATLGTKLGRMQFSLAHPHLYEKHADMAARSLTEASSRHQYGPSMPGWDMVRVVGEPDAFVDLWDYKSKNECTWPEYAPKPELIV